MWDVETSALQRCGDALNAALASFGEARRLDVGAMADAPRPPAADALDFLLETLNKDLHDLIRGLQGPR